MSKESIMINSNSAERQSENLAADRGVDLMDLVIVIVKNKKKIIISALVAMLAAAGLSMLLPNSYTARTQVLPSQSQSASAAMLGQLGGLSSLAGGALKNPNDVYIGILNSRTIADSLIGIFKLQTIYEKKTLTDARFELQNSTKIANSKENLISVEVTSTDPKLAAALANGYVEELQKMTSVLAITDASKRRQFFEKQLQKVKQDLVSAEVGLRKAQEKTGLIKLNEQAEGAIKAVANMKAAIAAKEIELGTMRTFATANSPDFIRAKQELAELNGQLARLEKGVNTGNGDTSIPVNTLPEIGLEYTRSIREIKYQEALFEIFSKQFELAKIDEAKEGNQIQVLDVALVPEKKSKPNRMIVVLLAAIFGAGLAIAWIFWKEIKNNLQKNPYSAKRLEELKAYSGWK